MPAPPGVAPIRLTRTGDFVVDGVTVTHPLVRDALWKGLCRDLTPAGWRVDALGGSRAVTVEDAPFFVRAVLRRPEGLILQLLDGGESPLGAGPLRLSAAGVLYATVRGEPARFLRAAQAQVEPWLRPGSGLAVFELADTTRVVPVLAGEEAA